MATRADGVKVGVDLQLRPSFTEILARLKNIQDMGKEIGPAPGAQPDKDSQKVNWPTWPV